MLGVQKYLASLRQENKVLKEALAPLGCTKAATAAATSFPYIKVLYMSGYTRDRIASDGRLEEGIMLLEKPFRKAELARKLRETIDA